MTTSTTQAVARPLRQLIPEIKEELEAADRAGLEHYRRAGELLLEAKAQLTHGEWSGWLKRHFTMSSATAHRYIKLVQVSANARARTFSTLSEAVDSRGGGHQHKVAWHRPVRDATADMERWRQERQKQEK